MSIFKVLESNIIKYNENYSEFLSDKKGDLLKGSEFMLYSLSSIFKDKEINDIEIGIVDSSYRGEKYDYGIDAIYITASKDFIESPEEVDDYNEDTKFNIHIFQFKRGTGISQADLLKFKKGITKVLIEEDLKEEDNLYFFNRMIIINEIKSKLYDNFSSDNINVLCHIVFGGIEKNLYTEDIINDELNEIKKTLVDGGFINSKIIITDCEGLINAPSKNEEVIDIVEYQKTFKYITDTDSSTKLNGYISIINGNDIAELVRKHQSAIFEANIRDYFKRNDLNSKIIATSSDEQESKFFWSYNNGLTMTCSKVEEMPNNKYKLHNLQIVNGCQTSNAIYQAVKNRERVLELNTKITDGKELTKKENDELDKIKKLQFFDNTSLLVKIIETKDEDLIYKITETTNSQTPIKAFSLRANDDIQKLIERFLESYDVAYERRINSLRNKGKKNVISIQRLFQLFVSQIQLKPSQVKTRPKTLFISTYDDVFPAVNVKSMNYVLYLVPIKVDFAVNKAIKEYLIKYPLLDNYKRTLISYGKLHLGLFMLSSIIKSDYNEKGIVKNEERILEELDVNYLLHLEDSIENFEKIMKSFAGNKKEAIPIEIRRSELDNRIAKYIKSRR